jgi:hypothetical protein
MLGKELCTFYRNLIFGYTEPVIVFLVVSIQSIRAQFTSNQVSFMSCVELQVSASLIFYTFSAIFRKFLVVTSSAKFRPFGRSMN